MGAQYMYVSGPLSDAKIEDLDVFQWPRPLEVARVAGLREEALALHAERYYALAAYRPTPAGIFETAWMMRGMDKFMMDMLQDKEFANALLDRILAIHLDLYRLQLGEVGDLVQIVEVLDDFGSQSGPLISPALYRELLKPREIRLVALIREFVL